MRRCAASACCNALPKPSLVSHQLLSNGTCWRLCRGPLKHTISSSQCPDQLHEVHNIQYRGAGWTAWSTCWLLWRPQGSTMHALRSGGARCRSWTALRGPSCAWCTWQAPSQHLLTARASQTPHRCALCEPTAHMQAVQAREWGPLLAGLHAHGAHGGPCFSTTQTPGLSRRPLLRMAA